MNDWPPHEASPVDRSIDGRILQVINALSQRVTELEQRVKTLEAQPVLTISQSPVDATIDTFCRSVSTSAPTPITHTVGDC